MILALGNSGAHEVEAFQLVVSSLMKRGVDKVVLFKQDKCLEHDFLTFTADVESGSRYCVTIDSVSYDVEDFTAVWNLKPHLPKEVMTYEPAKYRQLLGRQFNELRQAMWTLFRGKKWLNDPWAESMAESKIAQLKVAIDVGLTIPPTIVTSDPERVRSFFEAHDGNVILKLLAPSLVMNEVMYTSRLSREGLQKIDAVKLSPAIFQTYIEKAYELRITIVGDKIFAAKINSQVDVETSLDWRRKPKMNDFDVSMQLTTLPMDVEEKLLQLLHVLGLRFGCIDMIVTPRGEYVFLEINPNGQWYFVQLKTQAAIAEAIADLLV